MVVKATKKASSSSHHNTILISSDKTVITLSHRDQTLWLVYIIIGNLDAKTQQS